MLIKLTQSQWDSIKARCTELGDVWADDGLDLPDGGAVDADAVLRDAIANGAPEDSRALAGALDAIATKRGWADLPVVPRMAKPEQETDDGTETTPLPHVRP